MVAITCQRMRLEASQSAPFWHLVSLLRVAHGSSSDTVSTAIPDLLLAYMGTPVELISYKSKPPCNQVRLSSFDLESESS